MLNVIALRRELRLARTTFRSIARQPVSDDAPLPEQHGYWRLHDTAKAAYARLDWRWQKTLLRGGLLVLAALAPVSAVFPEAIPLAITAAAYIAWRVLVVLTRMAPGEED